MTVVDFRDVVVVEHDFPLLSGCTLALEAGTVTILRGANGAGKTSALRTMAGLVPVRSGEAVVTGIDLRRGDRRSLRRRIGWLGHEGSFYDDLTVAENLHFAARAAGRPVDELDTALERVGLTDRASVVSAQLSAGQRRRLALAWLVVRRPELWLLDEPHAALDPEGRELIDDIVTDAAAAGATVVVSAHEVPSAWSHFAQITFAGGRVAE